VKMFTRFRNRGKNLFIQNQEKNFELSEFNIVIEEHLFSQYHYQVILIDGKFSKIERLIVKNSIVDLIDLVIN